MYQDEFDRISKFYEQLLSLDKRYSNLTFGDICGKNKRGGGWSDNKKSIVSNKYDHICVKCGINKNIEIHHIVPRNILIDNDELNLIPLCYSCHYFIPINNSNLLIKDYLFDILFYYIKNGYDIYTDNLIKGMGINFVILSKLKFLPVENYGIIECLRIMRYWYKKKVPLERAIEEYKSENPLHLLDYEEHLKIKEF